MDDKPPTLADLLMSQRQALPPLDDQQMITRNKLMGPNWHKGYWEGEPDAGPFDGPAKLNQANQLRGLYRLYDAASSASRPQSIPFAAPGATFGLVNQLMQDLVRREFLKGK